MSDSCSCSSCASSFESPLASLHHGNAAATCTNDRDHSHSHNLDTTRIPRATAALLLVGATTWLEYTSPTTPGEALLVLYTVAALIAGYDVMWQGIRKLITGQALDECLLMSLACVGALLVGLVPGADPHMAEGAAVMIFYQFGEALQDRAVAKSRASVAALTNIAADVALVEHDGHEDRVDPAQVQVGQVVVVVPGARVPLDGIVESGSGNLDVHALTGEAVPREVEAGDVVQSGSLCLDSVLRIRTTHLYRDSTVHRIMELVEGAHARKAHTEGLVRRLAKIYTPLVVIAALVLAILPPLAGLGSWDVWVVRALTLLVVSCPCALVVSVPLALFAGVGGASKLGVLVKGAGSLEALSDVKTVAFDKTGTLTKGSFEVARVCPADGVTEAELITLAARAEAHSTHPIACSLRDAAAPYLDDCDLVQKDAATTTESAGLGITTVLDGAEVLVGSARLVHPPLDKPCDHGVGTEVHVKKDGCYLGHLVVRDQLRDDAVSAVAALRSCGIKNIAIISGDQKLVANDVATTLGADCVYSELLPADKVNALEDLMKDTPCAFVGDGINDAPALARANVGIALGGVGSQAAVEAADVVLVRDEPSGVATAIAQAQKTMQICRENVIISLGLKALVIALAAAGFANLWLAVVGDVGVALIAVANAMRCLRVSHL